MSVGLPAVAYARTDLRAGVTTLDGPRSTAGPRIAAAVDAR